MRDVDREFLEAVRSMVGTEFAHQGRKPGVGVDCLGLLVCALKKILFPVRDFTSYRGFPPSKKLLEELHAQLEAIPAEEAPTAEACPLGSVMVFRMPQLPRHVAIRSGSGMVHVCNGSRVTDAAIGVSFADRFVQAFRIPEREAWQL